MTDLFILSHFFQYASSFREISGDTGDRGRGREKRNVIDKLKHILSARRDNLITIPGNGKTNAEGSYK